MYDVKPNSHKYKSEEKQTEEKRVTKPVTNAVTMRKKSEARKFMDMFISEDASSVKSYVIMDVIVPAVKQALYDAGLGTLGMLLFGDSARRGTSNGGRSNEAPYVSYRSYSDNNTSNRQSGNKQQRYTPNEYAFRSRAEADEVLARLDEIIDAYSVARVADFYDLIQVSSEHTDNRYGWKSLVTARVEHSRDGWVIKFPRPLPID